MRLTTESMPGSPTRRTSSCACVRGGSPSTWPRHWVMTRSCHHARAQRAKRSSFTVKYCAPWSKRSSPSCRVDRRPPAARPLSKSVTTWPASLSARAAAAPATPAPMTATVSGLPREGRCTRRSYSPTSKRCRCSAVGRGRTVPSTGSSGENGRSNAPRHQRMPRVGGGVAAVEGVAVVQVDERGERFGGGAGPPEQRLAPGHAHDVVQLAVGEELPLRRVPQQVAGLRARELLARGEGNAAIALVRA